MRFLWKALAAAAVCFAAGAASATVIGFDDLPTSPSKWDPNFVSGPIPANYMGLAWEVGAAVGPVMTGSGWFGNISGATTTSGKNFITSNEGTVSFSMPDGRAFTFNGFSARVAVAPDEEGGSPMINLIGVGSHGEYLRMDFAPRETYQTYFVNWTVTWIMFGLAGDPMIDDIEINRVPEPTSLALVAIGLLAASGLSRKRR